MYIIRFLRGIKEIFACNILRIVPNAQETVNVSDGGDGVDVFAFLQTCLKESDGSDIEDFGSDHSEDCLSEASWEPVDKKETEVCPGKYILT